MKDTETILPQEIQQGYMPVFEPTKFPSSTMTPSFFLKKILLVPLNLSSYTL